MTRRFEGKVALVTGAARGQGRSHALRLAQEGADIIAVDIGAQIDSVPYTTATPDDLASTVASVERLDRRIIADSIDTRDLPTLTRFVDTAVAKLGRLDIVVVNHGIASYGLSHELTETQWSVMVDINLSAVWKTCKATVPHLIAGERGGSVILVASGAVAKATPNIAHYTAAKTGVVGLSRSMAVELGVHNIRVNVVLPGTMATPMVENDSTYRLFRPDLTNPTAEDAATVFDSMTVLPYGLLDPVEVSHAVAFLASDEARVITGAAIPVDAGASLK